MPPHASVPSATVDTAHVPASLSRVQTDGDLGANGLLPASHDSRQALAADATSLDERHRPASPGLASPASGRGPSEPPLAVRHPCLASSSSSRPSLDPRSSSPLTGGQSSATAVAASAKSPCLDAPEHQIPTGHVPVSWPTTSTFPAGATSLSAPHAGAVAASLPDSIPSFNHLPPSGYGGLNHAVVERLLSSLSSSFPGATAPSLAASFSIGPESGSVPDPGPVHRTAPRSAAGNDDSEIPSPPLGHEAGSAILPSSATMPPLPPRARSPVHLETDSVPLPRLSRSVSDNVVTSQPAAGTAHSLRQQLSFLILAWMADRERCGLERQQVEQELGRMHKAMEGDRQQWTSDKTAMEHQLDMLRKQVYRLEVENAALKTATARSANGDDVSFPRTGRQHLGSSMYALTGNPFLSDADDPTTASLSSNPSQQSHSSKAYIFSPPTGPCGAPRRAHFATPGSSHTSPSAAPAPSQAAALDPRQWPRNAAATGSMGPPGGNAKPSTSVIDVQELDPKLEGIPIKASAVQRSTFTAAAPGPASGGLDGQGPNGQGPDAATTRRPCRRAGSQNLSMDRGMLSLARRASSRDQTLQVLAAEESRRLTMHAGHTPNHSLSLLPTMTATGGDANGRQSVGATHSAEAQWTCAERDGAARAEDEGMQEPRHVPGHDDHDSPEDDDDVFEGNLEPCNDVPLKGPLAVRNIPAQDDLFFAQLDQKLETVRSGQDALPRVLRAPAAEQETGSRADAPPVPAPCFGRDGAAHEDDADDDADERDLEPDVPLRLRSTTNFGAPFGSM